MAQRFYIITNLRSEFDLQLKACNFKNRVVALPAAKLIPYGLQQGSFSTSGEIHVVNSREKITELDTSVKNPKYEGTYLHGPKGFGMPANLIINSVDKFVNLFFFSSGKSFLLYHYACQCMQSGKCHIVYVPDSKKWIKDPCIIVGLIIFAFKDVEDIDVRAYSHWFDKSLHVLIRKLAEETNKPVLVIIDQENYIYSASLDRQFPFNLPILLANKRDKNIFSLTSASANNIRYQNFKNLRNWHILHFNQPFDEYYLPILIQSLFGLEDVFNFEEEKYVYSSILSVTGGIPFHVKGLYDELQTQLNLKSQSVIKYKYVIFFPI